MKIAVIDLGTNTFNLIVAEYQSSQGFITLDNSRIAAKLGKGTINKNTLSPAAIERGRKAIKDHLRTVQQYQVNEILAFATSAIRNASNGNEFTEIIKNEFGIEIQIISGNQEAELIYKGVQLTLGPMNRKFLLLDIGGGSNEFIIADKEKIYWKRSFESGIARLIDIFHPSDPITSDEINHITEYLTKGLDELKEAVDIHKPEVLIGAAGSFDTFAQMIFQKEDLPNLNKLPIEKFQEIYNQLLKSTTEERNNMKGIENWQIEFIVTAIILVQTTLEVTGINEIYQTAYSLKEGVMSTYIDK